MSFLSEFSLKVSTLINLVGTDSFPQKLTDLFRELVPTDNVMIIAYPSRKLPVIEHNDLPPNDRISIVDQFINGAFLLDPYFLAATKKSKRGFFSLNEIAPSGFEEGEYNRIYFQLSGLSDECGYLISLSEDSRAFVNISLGQMDIKEKFSAKDYQNLTEITPLIDSLVKLHWQSTESEQEQHLDMRSQLETALECFGTSILTERENQMVQMILHGYSSKAIAEHFGISVETVKLHRKNAYHKLDLGTQGELFNLFINSLMNIKNYGGGDPLIAYNSVSSKSASS